MTADSPSTPPARGPALVAEQEGVLTSAQAIDLFGRAAMRAALAGERWRRLCHGVVVTHNGPLTARQSLWAAVLAGGSEPVVAGFAAACLAGLRLWRPDRIDLLVPAGHRYSSRRLPPDVPPVVTHRSSHLPDHHLRRAWPPRAAPARALVDAAVWARSDRQAQTVLVAGCQQRLVLPAHLLTTVAELPRMRRRSLIVATANDLAGGAGALAEIDFVTLCSRFRLPTPDLQCTRRDASGRRRYLDASWQRWRVRAEIDGAHHMAAEHWELDMRRQNDIWIAGDRLLRFSAWQVRHQPESVAGQLHAALVAAGWRPSTRQAPLPQQRSSGSRTEKPK